MQKLVSGSRLFTVSPRYIEDLESLSVSLPHRKSCGSSQMPRRHRRFAFLEGLGAVDFRFTGISRRAIPGKNRANPVGAFPNQSGW